MSITVGTCVKFEGTDPGGDIDNSVDVGAGANRGLLVAILASSTKFPMTKCQYAGVDLSLTSSAIDAFDVEILFAYLSAPASGSNTLSIHLAGGSGGTYWFGCMPLTGCHQTTASLIRAVQTATGSTSPISDSVSSAVGDLVIDCCEVVADGVGPLAPDASQTQLLLDQSVNGGSVGIGTSSKAGGASVTMTWTATNQASTGHVLVSVRPVASSGLIATVDGVARASISTATGVASASIATIDGVTA